MVFCGVYRICGLERPAFSLLRGAEPEAPLWQYRSSKNHVISSPKGGGGDYFMKSSIAVLPYV